MDSFTNFGSRYKQLVTAYFTRNELGQHFSEKKRIPDYSSVEWITG